MKYISLKVHTSTARLGVTFSTANTIRTVLEQAPSGANLAAIRDRIKILDLLDDAKGSFFALNNEKYNLLKSAAETFPFAIADKAHLASLDDIMEATDSPPNVVEMVKPDTADAA